ncbi:MFS transporter, SP family [Ancylostoma ceylanicum]|uniref:MFS transporter, SP family n=1 Tax=Ancylostoma ceylanicum TaxID=53326 RepID=A0A0D6LV25_9BILA|nr:MFS transporter, SP family [Ancylostoma ceylanicum]
MVRVNAVDLVGDNPKPQSVPVIGRFVYILAFAAVMEANLITMALKTRTTKTAHTSTEERQVFLNLGGFLFGYNTGVISAVMLFLPQNTFMAPVNAIWHQVITSMTSALAIVGALLSAKGSDYFGRRKVIITASCLFIIGALLSALSWKKITLVIAQALLGLAIGLASMIVPVYIGEASPSNIRGRLVTGFQLMITIGLVVANIIGGAFSYIDPVNVGWRLMFGCAAIPALGQLICFMFLPESPRWLYEHNMKDETEQVLMKVYCGHKEWVKYEMAEIKKGHEVEKLTEQDSPSCGGVFFRVLKTPHVRKALIIGSLLQAFQQLSGINTIMYYTGHIIRSSGVKDPHTTIWISVGTAAVNFLGTFIPMALVERMGRRPLFMLSVTGVLIALLAMGTTFVFINRGSDIALHDQSFLNESNFDEIQVQCSKYSNCDHCVTNEKCGFCLMKETQSGYCLKRANAEAGQVSAVGPCSSIGAMQNDFEWDADSCKTKLTAVFIVVMLFYLLSFSSGAYYLYAGFTLVALIFIYFFLPETRGYSIDEVEMLFMSKEVRERTFTRKRVSTDNGDPNITVIQLS